jgi:hypothetical protein
MENGVEISAEDFEVLAKAAHLWRTDGRHNLVLNDHLQRAAHERYGCLTHIATHADLALCELAQDRIGAVLNRLVMNRGSVDNYTGYELVMGKPEMADVLIEVLGAPE